MSDPDSGFTSYTYNGASLLTAVKNPFPLEEVTTYTYNSIGDVTRVSYHNNTYTTYAYDAANRLTGMANKRSDGTVISSFSYEYDKAGNRTKGILANGDYTEYSYDNTYQLLSETKKNSGDATLYSCTYTYDGAGNRESVVNYDGSSYTTYTYSCNNLNQLTSKGDGSTTTTYSYDDNGNLTSKGDGVTTYTYTWNCENKLTNATASDGSSTTFAYNADGLRIRKVDSEGTTKYVLDGLAVLKEYDGDDNPVVMYTPGISFRKDGYSYFYHYDGLGSTTELTGICESVVGTYTYDAFGNLISSSDSLTQPYQYVGEEYYYTEGNIGLQLLGQRWYDAEVGRFVSRDPILVPGWVVGIRSWFWIVPFLTYQPGSLYPYAYCLNNPVNLIDPWGLGTQIINPDQDPTQPNSIAVDAGEVYNNMKKYIERKMKTDPLLRERVGKYGSIEEFMEKELGFPPPSASKKREPRGKPTAKPGQEEGKSCSGNEYWPNPALPAL